MISSSVLSQNKKIVFHLVENAGKLEFWVENTSDVDIDIVKHTVMFGFGCGDWQFDDKGIVFEFKTDTEYVELLHSDNSKEHNMLCKLIRSVTDKAGKTVKLAYHSNDQLIDGNGNAVANRWSISPAKTVSFHPADINVAERIPANKPIDRSEWGACYNGRRDELPLTHTEILQECKLIPAQDPTIVNMRPTGSIKLVLRADFRAMAGKCVKLI